MLYTCKTTLLHISTFLPFNITGVAAALVQHGPDVLQGDSGACSVPIHAGYVHVAAGTARPYI